MIVTPSDLKAIPTNPHFKNKIAIAQVDSKKETNSLLAIKINNSSFQKALSTSLEQNGLLAVSHSLSRFDLFANLASLNQPSFGGDFQVTSNIEYRVVERETKITWYEEIISKSYTTTYSKSGLPVGGMRLANEGAIRENIKEFITRLSKKNPPDAIKVEEKKSEPGPLSAIQKLHDLQELLEKGLIKKEEYILKRDQILDSL
jgi:hypothetical protein